MADNWRFGDPADQPEQSVRRAAGYTAPATFGRFAIWWAAWHLLGLALAAVAVWATFSAASPLVLWLATQVEGEDFLTSLVIVLAIPPASAIAWAQARGLEYLTSVRIPWVWPTLIGTAAGSALFAQGSIYYAGLGGWLSWDLRLLAIHLSVAVAQWLALRRHLRQAWTWIAGSLAGFGGLGVGVFIAGSGDGGRTTDLLPLLFGLGVYVAATAGILWLLSSASPPGPVRGASLPLGIQMAILVAVVLMPVIVTDRLAAETRLSVPVGFVDAAGPQPVVGLEGVVAIDAGAGVAFAVKADGSLWGWGRDGGTALGVAPPGPCGWTSDSDGPVCTAPTPIQLPGLPGIVSVSTSGSHTLALSGDGHVWSWGRDLDYELGPTVAGPCLPHPNQVIACFRAPARVEGLAGVVDIAAGYRSSAAVLADGSLVWWGSVGTPPPRMDAALCVGIVPTPSRTPTKAPLTVGVVAIAAGDGGTIAAVTRGGVGLRLDPASSCATSTSPILDGIRLPLDDPATYLIEPPADAGDDRAWNDLMVRGGRHQVVRDDAGGVWTWGGNRVGQLGGPSPDTCDLGEPDEFYQPPPCARTPIRVDVPPVRAVVAGDVFSVALLDDGRVYRWGATDGSRAS